MIDFLYSNFPPVKTSYHSFADSFFDLAGKAEEINIAVGYVTAASLAELHQLIEINTRPKLNLVIGMHYFDKFTKLEYQAAKDLNTFLKENKLGIVKLANSFRFHGKMYSFVDTEGPFAGIVGSNNLSSLLKKTRVYEAAVVMDDRTNSNKLNDFILNLSNSACVDIESLEITEFNENRNNSLLENHELVKKASNKEMQDCLSGFTDIKFEIPLKTYEVAPKSSLNVWYGKGREDKRGFITPRPWYELEFIVDKIITSKQGYPVKKTESGIFDVITDDGWKFKCNVSGGNSKNFRSQGDLTILGKWMKGKLERAGVLRAGEKITEEILINYGRTSVNFIKTKTKDLWFLDYGVS